MTERFDLSLFVGMRVMRSRLLPYETVEPDGAKRIVHAVAVDGMLFVSDQAFKALKEQAEDR